MNERDLPPLSPFASALIAADRRRPGPPPALRLPAQTAPAPARRPAVRRFSLAAAAALVGRLSLGAKVAAAAVLVSGAVATSATIPWRRLGAPAHEEHRPRPAIARKSAHLAMPRPTPARPIEGTPPVPTLASSSPEPAPAADAASAMPARSAEGGHTPARIARTSERQLLDDALAALASREGAAATRALAAHARLYPHGDLVEERAALEVAAAVVRGDGAGATARAAEFHRRYPSSIFGLAVDRALASIR
jgi:hypothetical protein